jgi:hypothetical protein
MRATSRAGSGSGERLPATPVPWPEVMRRERTLVPGVVAAAAAIASIRLGLIPIAAALEPLARALGTSPAGVVGLGLAMAAVCDAWRVYHRFWRRHGQTRPANPRVRDAELTAESRLASR